MSLKNIISKLFSSHHFEGVDSLAELAMNLRWSWHHSSDKIWEQLDPQLWELTHNPCAVLQTVSLEKLESSLEDPNFKKAVEDLIQTNKEEATHLAWFQKKYPHSAIDCVAYFSMEYMLSEALPIYSGGLGNVAGDQLKAASDLGVPVIGVGLLYQQGYFRQVIDKGGEQQAFYPFNDPGQLPVKPLRTESGEWLRIEIPLPGWSLWLRAWEVQVGRVKLYLLDTNDIANYPPYRGITSELYGGGPALRLQQEMVLGIGGWRLLMALGLHPTVCHLNEGHAAFAVLDRARNFMKATKQPFDIALAATRAGNIFTTHTAVPAGFDYFEPALINQYLELYVTQELNISMNEFMALGRKNASDVSEPFNMAYLAVRGSYHVNGVSRLHGSVSRSIFASLFPRWPVNEVPVDYVTNGVHAPTWASPAFNDIWTEHCGAKRWLGETKDLEKEIRTISDEAIWKMRTVGRKYLIEYSRKRLSRQIGARGGASEEELQNVKHFFDPSTLTLGFARRFATYKRPNMLLKDPERLLRLLTNPQCPVQLIIAGKAHPADLPGQAMIKEWSAFLKHPEARKSVIFISDYDMLVTEEMVRGVDVWINTPRRPWEACGTSGMKVLVNGGLNLSVLDGWWAEAYCPEVGWALGGDKDHGNDPAADAADALALYDLLEKQVIPEFYQRNSEGLPTTWINRIRESMARLTPQYSANRAVREYTERHYLPAAQAYKERVADDGAKAKVIRSWERNLADKWHTIRFGDMKVETQEGGALFETQVYLGEVDAASIKVELYAEGDVRQMDFVRHLSGDASVFLYRCMVPLGRPNSDYTPRVVPYYAGVSVPLEVSQICWY